MAEGKGVSAELPVHLVRENNELRDENVAVRRDNSMRMLVFVVVSALANVFLIWLAFFHFPQTEFAWTSNAAVVCKSTPISEPHLNQQVVADYATQGAISIYTYDYNNYLRQITAAANTYFTPEFRDKFIPLFGDSQHLKEVKENFWVVSAFQNDRKPPQIARTGKRPSDGAFFWQIQVPLNVYYSAGRKVKPDRILATVTVVRTEPSRINPSGIAIDNIVTAQLID